MMSRLSKNIIYNVTGTVLLTILGFVAVKYIFGRLGEDAIGIIFFTSMIYSVISPALDMGICSTTTREVSAHYHSEPDYVHCLIRTGSLFYWGAYVLLGVAIYFLAPILVEKWINLKTMDNATAIYVLRVLGIVSFVTLPRSFYASLFRGLQRMEFNNIISVTITGLRQFGTIFILVHGGNLFHVVYWYSVCCILEIIAYLSILVRFFPIQAFIPGYYFNVVKRNMNFASKLILITFNVTLYKYADKVIISKLMSIGLLGYYGFAQKSVSIGTMMSNAIRSAAYPSFSALFGKGDRKSLMKQYRKLQDLVCFGNTLVLAVVPFAVLPLFSYVFNEEIAKLLLLPITLLSLGSYMHNTLRMPFTFSISVGRPDISAKAGFYALFIVLPLAVILIYYFGLIGAPLAIISRSACLYAYAIPRICSECLKIPVKEWYWHIFKNFTLVSLIYGMALYALSVINDYSIISLAIAYVCATIVFLICTYTIIGAELKETVFSYIKVFKTKLLRWPILTKT